MKTLLIVIAIIAVGGGICLAAQNALPGDILYPIKVGVTEKIFASPEKLALQRLEEFEQLAVENNLNSGTAAKALDGFRKQSLAMQNILDKKTDVQVIAETCSEFEGTLHAHVDILNTLKAQKPDKATFLTQIVDEVHEAIASATQTRIQAESKIIAEGRPESEVGADAESTKHAAENALSAAKNILEANPLSTDTSRAEATAQLHSAEEHFAEGNARINAKSFAGAFVAFQQALRSAKEVGERVSVISSLKLPQ